MSIENTQNSENIPNSEDYKVKISALSRLFSSFSKTVEEEFLLQGEFKRVDSLINLFTKDDLLSIFLSKDFKNGLSIFTTIVSRIESEQSVPMESESVSSISLRETQVKIAAIFGKD